MRISDWSSDVCSSDLVERSDDTVDSLHEAIKIYLTRLARNELDPTESRRTVETLSFTTNLEHVGDIIDKNLMELAAKKIRARSSFPKEGFAEIEAMHNQVADNLKLARSEEHTSELQSLMRIPYDV